MTLEVILCQSLGKCVSNLVFCVDREDLDKYKVQFASQRDIYTLEDALKNADVFVGLSKGNILTPDMILSMAGDPIVFAMANPTPAVDFPPKNSTSLSYLPPPAIALCAPISLLTNSNAVLL